MQDLSREIGDSYDFEVKSMIPFKEAFIINTQKGKKFLKKTLYSPERIRFIHGAKEHLNNNGFGNTDRYICTNSGDPFLCIDNAIYTISDICEGRECNFENRNEVVVSARLLAEFHKASKGYITPENSVGRSELGKLPMNLYKRLDEIKKLKKVAKKGKSKFDYLFLEHVDYFSDLAEDAIECLRASKYIDLVNKANVDGYLCHHDYTYRNIIYSEDKTSLINFDYCCYELKVYDIANLLRRKMRKCDWDINEAEIIIKEYMGIEAINSEELNIMKIIMQFPQKFWRVINKYYNSKRSWGEKNFSSKLQEVVSEIKYHKNFLEGFNSLYR